MLLATVFNILFLTGKAPVVLVTAVLSALLPLYLYQKTPVFSLVSALLTMAMLGAAYWDFSRSLQLYKKLALGHVWQTKTTVTALIISLAILTAGQFNRQNQSLNIKIPDELFKSATKLTSGLIGGGAGQPDASSLAQEAFESEIPRLKRELAKKGITDEDLVNRRIEEARGAFTAQLNESLSGKSDLGDSFLGDSMASTLKGAKELLEKQLNNALAPYKSFFPYALGILFFLTVSFFTPIFGALADLISFLIFKTLLLTKVAEIKTRSEEVEFLEM